ncbi:transmembrane adaptor Erv26-domain-containing protein [Zopfochytrium polystomum]|nr:transmembrane adaptor Erv26-domain-containing protein [Zopfochytrium polystomum]
MSFLWLLVIVGALLLAVFLLLSLASGLYYLSELVEEYSVMTKRVIKWTSIVVAACHLPLLVFDQLSIIRLAFSLVCQAVYAQLLPKFPNIQLFDPAFLGSCALVVANHFVWFFYFLDHPIRFIEIAAFFGLIIWLIPFMYFISLSANDYTLPAFDPSSSAPRPSQKKSTFVKSFLNFVLRKNELLPSQFSTSGASTYNGPSGIGGSSSYASSARYPSPATGAAPFSDGVASSSYPEPQDYRASFASSGRSPAYAAPAQFPPPPPHQQQQQISSPTSHLGAAGPGSFPSASSSLAGSRSSVFGGPGASASYNRKKD